MQPPLHRVKPCGAGLAVALSCVAAGCGTTAGEPADLVLRGGQVYTVDAARSWAQAVAIDGGRIVYVGSDSGASARIGPETFTIELAGRMVLPGFHDSHVHPVTSGVELGECELTDFGTRREIAAAVARCAASLPAEAWLRGSGWDLPLFPRANPPKSLLDSVAPDHPAYLTAADGHSAWVNSRALAAAGISRDTPDPPNGRIERDPAGEPSGTLREDAMGLVESHLPAYTLEDRVGGLERSLALARRFGITSLYEANGTEPVLRAYAELERRGGLTTRVTAAMAVDPSAGPDGLAVLDEWRSQYRSGRIRPIAAKIFVDGVIEAGTAALLEPYLDGDGDRGRPNVTPDSLATLVAAIHRRGLAAHLHAIGDRAVRMSLDAIAQSRTAGGITDTRDIMVHIQLIDPEDIPRFRMLGVIAGFQPLWAFADTYITELTVPRLGPERSRWLYPIASVVRTGAVVAAGSDWSVSSMNPLDAMQVAVTRRDPDDGPGQAWIPEEVLDLPTIIAAYTMGGAYAARQEHVTGSIEVGKAADLIVLGRNVFDVPVGEIHAVEVVLTMVEGEVVYEVEGWQTGGDR